jgi:hypothetical protein
VLAETVHRLRAYGVDADEWASRLVATVAAAAVEEAERGVVVVRRILSKCATDRGVLAAHTPAG